MADNDPSDTDDETKLAAVTAAKIELLDAEDGEWMWKPRKVGAYWPDECCYPSKSAALNAAYQFVKKSHG